MKLIFIFTFLITALSTFGQSPKKTVRKLGDEPVFFIDSINVDRSELMKYQPEEIAQVSVYKDSTAIKLVGPDGKDGVVYIETKAFAKNKYWNYFKSKSADYAKAVLTPQGDSTVQYILNGRILTKNFEGDLSLIDDDIFKEIKVIDKETLEKEYKIKDKSYGIIIKSDKPDNLYRAKKKF
jgi:hypothetical protein